MDQAAQKYVHLDELSEAVGGRLARQALQQHVDPALRRDYILTNARGVFGPQMSEYVFAYLLARERKLFEKQASQAACRWDPEPPTRLRGKQLGLLGVGTIGAAIASTAKHFGMRVKGYTRVSEDSADVDQYFHGSLAGVASAFGAAGAEQPPDAFTNVLTP